MNSIQKILLVITTAIAVYFILTAPKYYHRYSPRSGHIYKDQPFRGAKQEIDYSAIIPKLISLALISCTLIIVTSNLKIPKLNSNEFRLLFSSLILILALSIAHFGKFGQKHYYLLGSVYIALTSAIIIAWVIYLLLKRKRT